MKRLACVFAEQRQSLEIIRRYLTRRATDAPARSDEVASRRDCGFAYYTYERSYGSFTRTFTLPEGADTEKLSANLANGVLSIIVPKRPELQPKKIDVKAPTPATKS
jgi:HSP20 family protein